MRRFGIILLFASVFACVWYAAFYVLWSGDLFWHLKAGVDLLFAGRSPFVDHYSFTHLGKPILHAPWPFQALAGGFYAMGGFPGLQVLRGLCWTIPLAVFAYFLYRKRYDWAVMVFALTAMESLLTYRRLVRPEILSFTFIIVQVLSLIHFRNRPSWKVLGWLLLVQVIWVNTHFSSVMGYVILGGLGISWFLHDVRSSHLNGAAVVQLLLMGLAVTATGFLNPSMTHPLYSALTVSRDALDVIEEFHRFDYLKAPIFFKVYVPLLALGALWWLRRGEWGIFLIMAVFFAQLLQMAKLVPHVGVVTVPLLAEMFRVLLKEGRRKNLVYGFLLLVIGFSTTHMFLYTFKINRKPSLELTPEAHPVDIEPYLSKKRFAKIVGDLDFSGYLSFMYGPDAKVYIDGRTNILYPPKFLGLFLRTATDPRVFTKEFEKYKFDTVVSRTQQARNLIDTAIWSGEFEIVYDGGRNAVLELKRGRTQNLSYVYLRPHCLNLVDQDLLKREMSYVTKVFPANSMMLEMSRLLHAYFKADKPGDFWNSPINKLSHPNSFRLLAYLALETERKDLAVRFFRMAEKVFRRDDYFAMVELLCELDNCQGVEKFITEHRFRTMTAWGWPLWYRHYQTYTDKHGKQRLPADIVTKMENNFRKYIKPGYRAPAPYAYPCDLVDF